MITASKFKSLLNGGGSVKALMTEIKTLETESEAARIELGKMPAMRADLILADDSGPALDRMEKREVELERFLERAAHQLEPLKARLFELRRTELMPRIHHHQAIMRKFEAEIEAAVRRVQDLNRASADALRAGIDELGDDGIPFLPRVEFGGIGSDLAITMFTGLLAEQWRRIADLEASAGKPYKRPVSPFDLNNLADEFAKLTAWRPPV